VDKTELQRRTKQFALRAVNLVDALPRTSAGRAISNQLVRSASWSEKIIALLAERDLTRNLHRGLGPYWKRQTRAFIGLN